jgi:hypothetical protein
MPDVCKELEAFAMMPQGGPSQSVTAVLLLTSSQSAVSPAAVVVLECWRDDFLVQAAQEVRHQLEGGDAAGQRWEVCT